MGLYFTGVRHKSRAVPGLQRTIHTLEAELAGFYFDRHGDCCGKTTRTSVEYLISGGKHGLESGGEVGDAGIVGLVGSFDAGKLIDSPRCRWEWLR